MSLEETLLSAIHLDPRDDAARLALADCLEEHDRDDEAELARLHVRLRGPSGTAEDLARVNALLAAGVRPVVPTVTNSLGMTFALIPPGAFVMGSPAPEREEAVRGGFDADWIENEGPQHEVEITAPFYLGTHQVTREDYLKVADAAPAHFDGDPRLPVDGVSWRDAIAFCRALSRTPAERRAKRKYWLPTEAQWEYASRGGMRPHQATPFGDALGAEHANMDGSRPFGPAAKGTCRYRTVQVGAYRPNVFGLYDVSGNLWDWCSDWYAATYYADSPRQDPTGPARGTARVIRGGSWANCGADCRSANRSWLDPDSGEYRIGFRVMMFHAQGG